MIIDQLFASVNASFYYDSPQVRKVICRIIASCIEVNGLARYTDESGVVVIIRTDENFCREVTITNLFGSESYKLFISPLSYMKISPSIRHEGDINNLRNILQL